MFKKRAARNLRQKRDDSDDETAPNENGDTNSRQSEMKSDILTNSTSMKPPNTVETSPNTEKITASASSISLLSFADEDIESTNDVFQVKKSSQSKKLERARRKTKIEEEKEPKIATLKFSSTTNKKKTDFKSSSKIVIADDEHDSIIIVKEEEKRKHEKDQVILTGKDAEAADMAIDDAQDLKKKFSANEIPDANLIHLARKQRQMARDAGGSDYIPLDDTQRYRDDAAAAKSRLIREDDENDVSSGEEEGVGAAGAPVFEPRRFYSRLRNENDDERRRTETDFLQVEQGSDEEHDDELDKWEQEQIRKGVSVQQISSYRQEQMASAYYYSSQTQSVYSISGYDYAVLSNQYSSSAQGYIEKNDAEQSNSEVIGPQPMDLDIELHNDEQRLPKIGGGNASRLAKQFDLNAIRLRIKEKFDEKQNVERSVTSDLEQKCQYIEENIVTLDQLKKCQPNLEQKLQLFQEIRSYVRDILDCLDEKLPIIEKLEEASLTLFSNRTHFVVKRRRQDVKDQFDEISLLSIGKSLDNNDADRMMRSSERDARKARRRQAREKTLTGLGHHDGMSSDDEEAPSRTANFTAELGKISQEIPAIWSDVEEDYCSMKKIIDRFYDWKNIDRLSYEKCYADICLPKLLGPIIRSEMITYNLFQVACPLSFEYFEWFKQCMNADKLLENSVNHEQQATTNNGDTNNDVRLSASVIEKVICPKIKAFVEQVWDPVSTLQSERLSTLIKIFVFSFLRDKTNSKLKELFDAIYKRIKTALDEDLFTPIYSKEVIENKAIGAAIFLEKQFWLALKILKNIGFWDNVMASKIVEELSLDGVVNRHVVLNLQCSIYVDVGILTKLKSLTNLITPSQWFQTLKKIDGVNQLEPLYKIMRRICEQIHDSKSMNSNEIHDIQKDICRLMQKLRDTHHNKKLIEKYRLKL